MHTIRPKPVSAARSQRGRQPWPTLLALLVIVVAALGVLWRPIVLGEVFLPLDLVAHFPPWRFSYERTAFANPLISDLVNEYYPRRLLASEMIRQGQLPLWNPYILGGMPLLADGYSATLYPASLLFVLLPVAQAFGWYAFLHLLLAGVGTFWLARTLGLFTLPALAAALTYMGCGFTMNWLVFPDFSPVIALLPVMLCCVEQYEQRRTNGMRARRWLLGAAVALACCALCQLQLTIYAAVALACFWLLRRLASAPRELPGMLVAFGGVAGLALLLSAAQVLPTLELVLNSQRTGVVADIGTWLTLPTLLKFFTPFVVDGVPRTAPDWGPAQAVFLYPYVGLLPLLLAVIGAWRAFNPGRAAVLGLALVTLALLALPASAMRDIPLLNQLPAVDRWTLVLSLTLALLAGMGLQAICEATEPVQAKLLHRTRVAVLLAGMAMLALVFVQLRPLLPGSQVGAVWTLLRERTPQLSIVVGMSALSLVALALLLKRLANHGQARPMWSGVLAIAALLLIAFDGGWHGLPLQSSANPRTLFQPTPDLVAAIAPIDPLAQLDGDHVYPPNRMSHILGQQPGLFRVLGGDYPSLAVNAHSVFHIQDARGWASLFSRQYLHFIQAWSGENTQSNKPLTFEVYVTQAYRHPQLLDMLNIEYLVFNPQSSNEANYQNLELIERNDEGAIYRNPRALPRAFLVHQAEQLGDDQAVLERLTAPDFAPANVALLTVPLPELAPPATAEPTPIITRYTPLEVVIEAAPVAPALLVLSDTYYPGWEATIDGQQTPILVTNTVLRGVAVPAGRHEIVFRYRPLAFYGGVTISITTLLSIIGVAVWRWRLNPKP